VNVRLSVASFTASSIGSSGRPRLRTEAVADLCCPVAAGRREGVARVSGTGSSALNGAEAMPWRGVHA
jgi:hypothetical protein